MDTETTAAEELKLNRDQQAEIGDIFISARAVSQQMVAQAKAEAEEIVRRAEDTAADILRNAEEKAAAIVRAAEEKTGPSPTEVEMQEYAVRAVEDCFSRLRRQQLDILDMVNEQWRRFLSSLNFSDGAVEPLERPDPAAPEISQQDIETRVNAIARELMEIIGTNGL